MDSGEVFHGCSAANFSGQKQDLTRGFALLA
jgi:hypothetical protein